jgi:hypothetical protein
MFLSEPIKKGHARRYSKGFNTTHKSKLEIAAKLKQLIENNTLKLYSKPLISQLKAYVAKGLSFEEFFLFTEFTKHVFTISFNFNYFFLL